VCGGHGCFAGHGIAHPLDESVICTPRLVLRPYRLSDAQDWYAIQSDPTVLHYLAWRRRDRSESLQHLRDRTRHTRLWQADDLLALAIQREGHLVGDVSLHLRTVRAELRSAEIGWLLASSETGQGIASEAANAVLDLAFDQLGAQWVFAVVQEHNERSLALAARLGFVQVHRQPNAHMVLMLTPELHAARQTFSRGGPGSG